TLLSDLSEGDTAIITAVAEDEKSFLDHLNTKDLRIGDIVTIKKKEQFDGSIILRQKSKKEMLLTLQVAERIWVE
ncbi:MAG: ferrous iron transport protein A, partial [Cyclobacteriaceae bacterium]|nr:ferrous iron transport protein A [Cyclobacteriaceae bacterium]